jgi:hypothetical protein
MPMGLIHVADEDDNERIEFSEVIRNTQSNISSDEKLKGILPINSDFTRTGSVETEYNLSAYDADMGPLNSKPLHFSSA